MAGHERSALIWIILTYVCSSAATPRHAECYVSTFGAEYRGRMAVTESGRPCQRWDSQTPHSHGHNSSLLFPDRHIGLAENYCRNPVTAREKGPWCYTTDPKVKFEHCNITKCPEFPECKLTEKGESYRGSMSTSKSKATCLPWQDVAVCDKEDCDPAQASTLDKNYCRNPDKKPGGPWCYVGDGTKWEYCHIPFCKPSASCSTSASGGEYVGTVSTTRGGIHCQRWDDIVPHKSNYTKAELFPDKTIGDAADFCRNPGGEKSAPWCYTINPQVEWGYCDVPKCAGCRSTDAGPDYAGTVFMTSSGVRCQRWDSQYPHRHIFTDPDRFPDRNLDTAANYCRNPDDRTGGPWCFTSDPDLEWQSCDLPMCSGDKQDEPRRGVKHVIHIGVDGLHPCFATNVSAPNLMPRLSQQGSWTLTGRTAAATWSAPGWTTILCSMPIETSGVLNNTWLPPWNGFEQAANPISGKDSPFPCIFDVLKRQDVNIRTGSFHGWDWLQYLMSTGLPGRLDTEMYCGPTSEKCDNSNAGNLTNYLSKVLVASQRSYTFIHLDTVDGAGHKHGWCESKGYHDTVRFVDRHIGKILDLIDEMKKGDEVFVVVCSDHGGHANDHGAFQDSDLVVPLFFKGPGIKANYKLEQVMRNIDIPPTIIRAMGYQPSPWWRGQAWEDMFLP